MRKVLTRIVAICLFLSIPALAEENEKPLLLLTVNSGDCDEKPGIVCLLENDHPLSKIRCYEEKTVQGGYCLVGVHVCGMNEGFLGLSFGIEASGAPVSFTEFVPCPGFAVGPSQAGIPEAIIVSSTTGCRHSREAVGYAKYVRSDNGATYFDIVPNSELAHSNVINCEVQYEEAAVFRHAGHTAQWGGEQSVSCPYAWPCIETGFWFKILLLFR
ncbi:MAG: hypothetical protein AMJ46_07275 [Latescibacteria bacterium DG_63]|nr:MAG: hypothetical protein AMJ46_07275 [Latescibacteria bacterium DG_63]